MSTWPRVSIAALAAWFLACAPTGMAMAAPGAYVVGPDSSYTEDGVAVAALPSFTLSDNGQDYVGGTVTFAIDGSNEAGETLSFEQSTPSIVDDVISVQGTTVFKGNGSLANAIGNIDGTLDGDGADLKVNFSNSFENGDFSNGSTGWTITNSRVNLGYIESGVVTESNSTIAGFTPPVDATWGPGASASSQWDRASAPNGYSSSTLSGKLTMTVGNGSCSKGYCVLRGPAVVSDASVYLASGDEVSFDWSASGSGDAFDVYGYLVNTSTGKALKLIDETGSVGQSAGGSVTAEMGSARNEAGYFTSGVRRTNLKTYTVGSSTGTSGASSYDDRVYTDGSSFVAGNYRFVFIAGTYDDSGGRALGASFSIDNVTVSSAGGAETVTAADIQSLARLLTYSNSTGLTASRTLTFSSSESDTSSGDDESKVIRVTPRNDPPTLSTPTTVAYTDSSAEDSFSASTQNLSATDEEGDAITYGISGVSPISGVSTLSGTFGELSVTTAGSLSFSPNVPAINALDADATETFTVTASDGNSSGSATLTISIAAQTDLLPSRPTITSISAGDGSLTVSFTAPASSGTTAISNYKYSTDGTNYVALSPAQTSSPFRIATLSSDGVTALTNGTSYSVTIKATNSSGDSIASNSASQTPVATVVRAPVSEPTEVAPPRPVVTPPSEPAPARTPLPETEPALPDREPRPEERVAPEPEERPEVEPATVAEREPEPEPTVRIENLVQLFVNPAAAFEVAGQVGEPVSNAAIGASGDDAVIVEFDPQGSPEAIKATNNLVGATAAVAGVAAAAGAAAAGAAGAAAGAAGAAGSAAGAAGSAGSAGSAASSGGGTGAGGGGGSTGNAPAAEMNEDVLDALAGADYVVDRFRNQKRRWGDKLFFWRFRIANWWDAPSTWLSRFVAPFSPLLARLLNDASYLRAMTGPGSLLLPGVGVWLALESLSINEGALLHPPVALYMWLVILGVFDAFAGSLAMAVFVAGSLPFMDFGQITDWRMLAGIVVSGFGPIVIARSIRDFRRPAPKSRQDWLIRLGDLAFASLMGGWVAGLIIRSLPALTGLTLPAANYVMTFQIYATLAIGARIVVEDFAARFFPARMDELTPDTLPEPPVAQIVVAQVLRFAFYILIASAFMGFGPVVWFAALLFMTPGILGFFVEKFPNSKTLWRVLPTGLAGLAMILGLEIVLENSLGAFLGDHPNFSVIFIFCLLGLIITVSILGMLGREGTAREIHWLETRRYRLLRRMGAVIVFVLLIQFTSML